jgi:hypothetical protein
MVFTLTEPKYKEESLKGSIQSKGKTLWVIIGILNVGDFQNNGITLDQEL